MSRRSARLANQALARVGRVVRGEGGVRLTSVPLLLVTPLVLAERARRPTFVHSTGRSRPTTGSHKTCVRHSSPSPILISSTLRMATACIGTVGVPCSQPVAVVDAVNAAAEPSDARRPGGFQLCLHQPPVAATALPSRSLSLSPCSATRCCCYLSFSKCALYAAATATSTLPREALADCAHDRREWSRPMWRWKTCSARWAQYAGLSNSCRRLCVPLRPSSGSAKLTPLVPQWKSWRKKDTAGLSTPMMLIWFASGIWLGAYWSVSL